MCVCVRESVFVAGLCYMCLQFSSAPPPVIVQTCVQTTCYVYFLVGRPSGTAEELAFFYLWVHSAPSGGRHGQHHKIFGSLETVLSSAHE